MIASARVPRNFKDPGAFDYRGELARQGIELTASLRNLALVAKISGPRPTAAPPARAIARLAARPYKHNVLAGAPQQAAVLRAMLLGDRGFR